MSNLTPAQRLYCYIKAADIIDKEGAPNGSCSVLAAIAETEFGINRVYRLDKVIKREFPEYYKLYRSKTNAYWFSCDSERVYALIKTAMFTEKTFHEEIFAKRNEEQRLHDYQRALFLIKKEEEYCVFYALLSQWSIAFKHIDYILNNKNQHFKMGNGYTFLNSLVYSVYPEYKEVMIEPSISVNGVPLTEADRARMMIELVEKKIQVEAEAKENQASKLDKIKVFLKRIFSS